MKLIDFLKNLFKRKKKTLALALGCGGAKGFAIIGVLKAFEEENIKFDIVAGSSIGSVIGGMYASGVTIGEMLDYIKEYNLTDPKSLLLLKLKGYTVEKLLSHITGGKSFDELLIPFAAVATDIKTGEEVDITDGLVARAMCASSAIPPVFSPVSICGRSLVDGGFVNAVPSSVCKKLGADVVIGVNLCSEDYNSVSKASLDKFYKQNGVKLMNTVKSGRENSDFFIEPDLHRFTGYSILNSNEMFDIGYRTAKAYMNEIVNMLIKKKVIKKRGKRQK